MYTISVHTQGDAMVVGHNRRDAVTLKEDHIDHNGVHETWIDTPIKQFYRDTFTEAAEVFNQRERRAAYKVQDYYMTVKNDHKKHLVYESIIQIGNTDRQPTEPMCREVLKEYLDEFVKNNPTMVVIGAYYHADEPQGTPHLHLDYVPVAESKRGMAIQNSHSKAIEQLGIEKGHYKNLAHAFQERERDRLEQICKEHGLDIERGVCTDKRRHLEKDAFVLEQKLEQLLENVSQLELLQKADALDLKTWEDIERHYKVREKALDDREAALDDREADLDEYAAKVADERQQLVTIENVINARKSQEVKDLQELKALKQAFPQQMKQLITQLHKMDLEWIIDR